MGVYHHVCKHQELASGWEHGNTWGHVYLNGHAKLLQSCLTLTTPWTVSLQAPLSKGFSRQEYWSGLPCPPPGDLLDPGMEPKSLMSPALAGATYLWHFNVSYDIWVNVFVICHRVWSSWWEWFFLWFLIRWVKWKPLSHVWLFVTLWVIQSMEFSRPEYWSG